MSREIRKFSNLALNLLVISRVTDLITYTVYKTIKELKKTPALSVFQISIVCLNPTPKNSFAHYIINI